MIIRNKNNTRSAILDEFSTNLLLGESNTGSREISIQITTVLPNGMQFLHSHKEEQCYYIVSGNGTMFVEGEQENVAAGDAIFVPSHANHGIKNSGKDELVYLTANRAFGVKTEAKLWPQEPS